ncbi:MAG: AAA family ATPase, partial [Rubripirellula sp.]|nr:AAA family ATPase [Rubripirellula sp.]
MLLERLDLKAFGRFTDVSLELRSGSRNFHLIYGPNEAGKSTSLRAITSLLFGMESNTNDCFLHRPTDIRVGGVLLDSESGSRLECVRRRGRKQTLRDADDRDPISNEQLHQFLGGIGRETFETRFGLSYDALVDGGEAITKGGGDLGEILFAAGAGVSQLRKLQDEFEDAASRLFAPRASKSSINAALKGMDVDRQAMKDLQVSTSTYEKLRSDLEKHQADGRDLKEQLTESVKRLELLKSYRDAVSLIPAWRDAKQGLLQFGGVPSLTDEFITQRHDAHSALEIAKAQREKLQERLKTLRQRESKLCPDLSLLQCELQVQNAFQQLAIYKKSEQQCENAIRELQGLDIAVNELLMTLSKLIPTGEKDLSTGEALNEKESGRYRLHASSLLRMRDLTQQHKDLVLREREANDAVDSARIRLKSINQQLSVLGDVGDPSLLTGLLESVGKPAMIAETISRQRDQCGKVHRECQQALANLTGFHGELREALAIGVPDQSLVDDFSAKIEELETRGREQELKMQQRREELEHVQSQLSHFAENTECPSDEQISKAIGERDEFVNHYEQSPPSADERAAWVGDLRALIGSVDHLLDERFKYAEQIQQRIALQQQRDSLEAVLASYVKQGKELQDASSAVLTQWEAVWEQVGVRAGSVAEMQRWTVNHLALRQIALAVDEEEARLARLLSAATRDVQRLREAIGLSVPSDSVGAVQAQTSLF